MFLVTMDGKLWKHLGYTIVLQTFRFWIQIHLISVFVGCFPKELPLIQLINKPINQTTHFIHYVIQTKLTQTNASVKQKATHLGLFQVKRDVTFLF